MFSKNVSIFKSKITPFACIFIALLNLFLFGSFSNKYMLEENASDIAMLARDNKTEYVTISVFNNEHSEQALPVSSEFYSVYSIFNINENKCTFAATGNANKNHNISINEINDSTKNYSIVYADFNSNKEYKGHWKHEFYPLELMFRGDNSSKGGAYSFCYVGQSDADIIMRSIGMADYDSLIGTNICINVDSVDYFYTIGNIYLEQNYFYHGLKETIGDFIFTYTKFPSGVKKENTYFLNSFQYQNRYHLNRIVSKYSKDSFDVQLNTLNLIKYNKDKILRFFYSESSNLDWLFICSVATSIILLLCSLAWSWFYFQTKNILNYGIFAAALFLPYLLAKFSFEVSKSSLFFSYLSSVINLISVVIFLAMLVFIIFIKKYRKEKAWGNAYYKKINI